MRAHPLTRRTRGPATAVPMGAAVAGVSCARIARAAQDC